jgi:hypothetical protein
MTLAAHTRQCLLGSAMFGDHMAELQNGPLTPTDLNASAMPGRTADVLPAVAAVLPAIASIVPAVFTVVAPVVTAVLAAVPAAVDAVRDDNGAAHGGNGPAPTSGCKWHISFLPRCRLRWQR